MLSAHGALSTHGVTLNRKAFSLVELIVVVAILGVLISLLLPAIQRARESARRMSCSNNLHQLGIALHSYHQAEKRFPPGWIVSDLSVPAAKPKDNAGWAWGAMLLPFVEQTSLDAGFLDIHLAIHHDRNQFARTRSLAVFRCPSSGNRGVFSLAASNRCGGSPLADLAAADYVGVTARSSRVVPIANCATLPWSSDVAVFGFNQSAALRDISDGVSQTFILGERACKPFPSAWAGALPAGEHPRARVLGLFDSTPQTPAVAQRENVEFSSQHPAGSQFLLADGAVRIVTVEIDPPLFKALGTRAGGETVSEFFVGD